MNNTNQIVQFVHNQMRSMKKERRNSRRFRDYYLSDKEDTRGKSAKVLDYIIGRIVTFFILLLGALMTLHKLIPALGCTIALFSLFQWISVGLRNKKLERMRAQKRRLIGSQKILQDMMNKTQEELSLFFRELLIGTGFTNLKEVDSTPKIIRYQGIFNQERLLMCLYVNRGEMEVELKDIKECLGRLKAENLTRALMMTTTDFTTDCRQFVEQGIYPYRILLMNRELLLKLLEKNHMFPGEEVIDELVENQISKREARWQQYKESMAMGKKTRGYLTLALFLIVTGGYTPYTKYYYAMAGISVSMAILTTLYRLNRRRSQGDEAWYAISQMLKNL